MIIINSLPMKKDYYLNKHKHYVHLPIFKEVLDPFTEGGSGVTLSENDVWKRKRRILSKSFHFEFVKSLSQPIIKISNDYFDKIDMCKEVVPIIIKL